MTNARALPHKQRSRERAYMALTLVKRLGRYGGFTSQMINLLDYYMSFTRSIDWEEGAQPIVYQSLNKTAFDLGLSVRQIQRIEKRLFEAGVLNWQDSPNNKRYGQRSKDGRLINAYGVNLAPLCEKIDALEYALHEKQHQARAWASLKHSVHKLRKTLFAADLSQFEVTPEEEAALKTAIRSNLGADLLQSFIRTLTQLSNKVIKVADKNLAIVDKNVVHKESTKLSNNIKQLQNMGLNKITLNRVNSYLARQCMKRSFRNWHELIKFAEDNYDYCGISAHKWHYSECLNGKLAASLQFLIVLCGLSREKAKIYNPKAYFNALIKCSAEQCLFLDRTIW